MIVVYWIGFCIGVFYIIELNCGQSIRAKLVETTRAPSEKELEEQIFRKMFKDIDKKKQQKIPKSELPKLLAGLGIYIPDEDIPDLIHMLDPDDTGDIGFYPLFNWFKVYNAAGAEGKYDEGKQRRKSNNKNNVSSVGSPMKPEDDEEE